VIYFCTQFATAQILKQFCQV